MDSVMVVVINGHYRVVVVVLGSVHGFVVSDDVSASELCRQLRQQHQEKKGKDISR